MIELPREHGRSRRSDSPARTQTVAPRSAQPSNPPLNESIDRRTSMAIMSSRFFVIAAVVGLGVACSTTRYSAPPSGAFQAATLAYPILKGRSIQLAVLDHRGDRQESESLVQATRDSVAQSLTQAGVQIANASEAKFEIRIVAYRADFELAQWNGCVRFVAVLDLTPQGRSEVPVERCVKRSNLWGYRSGDEAVQQAYSDALAELLSRVDQLR